MPTKYDTECTVADQGGGVHRISWLVEDGRNQKPLTTAYLDVASTAPANDSMKTVQDYIRELVDAEQPVEYLPQSILLTIKAPEVVVGVTLFADWTAEVVISDESPHTVTATIKNDSAVIQATPTWSYVAGTPSYKVLEAIQYAARDLMRAAVTVADLGASGTITFEPLEPGPGLTLDPPYTVAWTRAGGVLSYTVADYSGTIDTGSVTYPTAALAAEAMNTLEIIGREAVSATFIIDNMVNHTLTIGVADYGDDTLDPPYTCASVMSDLGGSWRAAYTVKNASLDTLDTGNLDYPDGTEARVVYEALERVTLEAVRDESAVSDLSATINSSVMTNDSIFDRGLDQYGGAISNPSPGGNTGFWRLEQDTNIKRWWFVSPDGNRCWLRTCQQIGPADFTATNWTALENGKYHSANAPARYNNESTMQRNYAMHANRRLIDWGFNCLGWASGTYNKCVRTISWNPGNPIKLPFGTGGLTATYAETNEWSTCYDATMDIMYGNTGGPAYEGGWLPDVYAPQYAQFYKCVAAEKYDQFNTPERTPTFQKRGGWQGSYPHPSLIDEGWLIYCHMDENDRFRTIGPGKEMVAVTIDNKQHTHTSYIVLCTRATQTTNPYSAWDYIDTECHSLTAFQDMLIAKYTTIAALNTAWGSSYTQWGTDLGWGNDDAGFMDEDGSSSYLSGIDKIDCSGVIAAFKTDCDDFDQLFWTEYFQVVYDAMRVARPNHITASINHLNAWKGMSRRKVLAAANGLVDMAYINYNYFEAIENNIAKETYDDVGTPIMFWHAKLAQEDSPMGALNYRELASGNRRIQELRGLDIEDDVKRSFRAIGTDGYFFVVGWDLWEWVDKHGGEDRNFGWVSQKDNAYDGSEGVVAAGSDPWGYDTGGEAANYGDCMSHVRRINRWVQNMTHTNGLDYTLTPVVARSWLYNHVPTV
ncbi:MAG: hypothetical protein ACYSX1_02180 [Planctomycetota bacterium]|jgi:hypothetical protein